MWTCERIASDNLLFRTSTDFADLYMPFDGVVFFADAGNGDQFFMSLSGTNEVYVWDHENDSRTWVAATVLRYLRGRRNSPALPAWVDAGRPERVTRPSGTRAT